MRKINKSVLIILLIIFTACFTFGCNNGIKYGKVFTEYYYSQEDGVFYSSNRYLTLNKNKTFSMSLQEIGNVSGSFEEYNDQNLIKLNYDTSFSDQIIAEFKKKLQNNTDSSFNYDEIEDLVNSIQFSDLFYNYENYLFSNSFIEAYRYVDVAQASEENYLSIEGVYVVKDFDVLMLLKNGIIYTQNLTKPIDNEYPVERGSYSIENDFLVMNFIMQDEAGNKTEYTMKYLIAEVALPQDLNLDDTIAEDTTEDTETEGTETEGTETETEEITVSEDEEWLKGINEQLKSLQGKKIKALVKAFYTYRSL